MRLVTVCVTAALTLWIPFALAAPRSRTTDAVPNSKDPRLAGSYTFERGGWTFVHLQGSPQQIGFQHGYLLGPQIADAIHVFKVEDSTPRSATGSSYRDAAKNMFWPHIDAEYQAELTASPKARRPAASSRRLGHRRPERHHGAPRILRSLAETRPARPAVELPGRLRFARPRPATAAPSSPPAATPKTAKSSSPTTTGPRYAEGSRWTIMFDIEPTHGHRILQDGVPGMITSTTTSASTAPAS